jgi:ribose transport system permease protein
MLWIAHGLGYVFMKGEVIYGLPEGFRLIGAGFLWGIPIPVLIAAALVVVLHVLLHATVLGRAIYAIGGNPIAARLSGMPVTRHLITVYALSGVLSGFAGLVVIGVSMLPIPASVRICCFRRSLQCASAARRCSAASAAS